MSRRFPFWRKMVLTAGCLPGLVLLGQNRVTVPRDPAYPSAGSRAPFVLSLGGTAEVELATTNPGPTPVNSLGGPPRAILTPSPTLTFTGMTQTPSLDGGFTYKPPDTHHAVGPGAGAAGRLVHVTNTGIQIYNKSGASVAGPSDLDIFLTALGATGLTASGVANLGFDPKVLYDQHSGRFFVVILDGRTPGVGGRSNVHICTSTTSTPGTLTGADWTVETASALTTFGATDGWFDYPALGADATRLVVTGNIFDTGGSFIGTKIRVFLKSSLTDNGAPAGATFNDINIDASVTSAFSLNPCHVFGATLNSDFYLISRFGSTTYTLAQITGAGGAATLVPGSPTTHAWTAGAYLAAGAEQIDGGLNGVQPTIATLSSRIQNAVYRDAPSNPDSIWLALTSDPDGDSRSEVFWAEIDPNSSNSAVPGTLTTPAISQSGFLDGTTPASDWTFMPAISINISGDAMITYNQSSSTTAVSILATAQHVGDVPGTFQTPVTIATGAGEYDDFNPDAMERWGDYAGMAVDPDDDETFWLSGELCQTAVTAAGNDADWGTRIARMGVVTPVELISFSVE